LRRYFAQASDSVRIDDRSFETRSIRQTLRGNEGGGMAKLSGLRSGRGRWLHARYARSWRKSRRNAPRRLQVESLEGRQLLAADVAITEFMASNNRTLLDEDGAASDWIELTNRGDATASLDGWFLTDDARQPDKWRLPAVTLDPGAYLIVFASGKDRARAVGELHTNFKLSASGEYVGLIEPGGTVISEFGPNGTNYPIQFTDISYGAAPVGSRYFSEPTPGQPNADGFLEFLGPTTASVRRGFFNAPFSVELSTDDAAATIRYTTDGSRPSETNGTVYSGPLTIGGTTTLRSAAFKPDAKPGPVDTETYLFPDDVLRQSATFGKDGTGIRPTAPWGRDKTGDGALNPDWDVDPDIVHHPLPDNRFTARDLRAVPTLSLTLPWEDMFGGDGRGIYIDGKGDPRGASIEQILPDGSTGFQIDGSVQIQGNSSTERWNIDKLSMRVKLTREFGATQLNAPLFGKDATDHFDTFILDAVHNFGWLHGSPLQANDAKYIQDQFVANLHNATGGTSPHGNYQYLYINGIFWGMYYVHERADASFAASYFGGTKDDYDVIKHDPLRTVNKNPENYFAMLDLSNKDLSDNTNYQNLAQVLDIDGLIDYVLVNFYVGNSDWGVDNWIATFNHNSPDGKWRFHSWDAEEVLNDVNDIKTANLNNPRAPTGIHHRLLANAEYRLRFADHVQKHYFNGGVLTPEKAAAEYRRLMAQVDRAIVGESARWGDNRRDAPYTRQEWLATQQKRFDGFFPRRTAISLNQFKQLGLFPDVDSPSFNQLGGRVARSFQLELTAPAGTIYYTTDGTDPRLPGGAIAPTAIEYTGRVRLTETGTVQVRAIDGDQWSAVTAADFVVVSDVPLRVTEVEYNPHDANPVAGLGEANVDNDQFEFLELTNTGDQPIDLAGMRLAATDVAGDTQGVRFEFAPQTLEAGERVVVVRDRAAFQSRYGTDVTIAAGTDGRGGEDGQFGGKLSNGGERITLLDADGGLIEQFDYGTDAPWPARANGRGSSLELVDPAADATDPGVWRASGRFGGSPGQAGQGDDRTVIVNEVLANPASPRHDQIELANTTGDPIDVAGWYLSDSPEDYFKYKIAGPSLLPGGGYVAFDQSQFEFDLNGSQGGAVGLITADASGRPLRFADRVAFAASPAGVAVGRWPDRLATADLVPMIGPTFGAANLGVKVGAVLISEVHYNAPRFARSFDFQDAAADPLNRVLGNSRIVDGRYQVMPASEGNGDTVSLFPAGVPTGEIKITATLRVPSVSDFNKNGVFIFDYHGPTDFKFASFQFGRSRVRIGQRDATGWNFLADEASSSPLVKDTDLDVTVEIRGPVVEVLLGGVVQVRHRFEGLDIFSGDIGLGSKNGQADFDDVVVASLRDQREFEFVELTNPSALPVDIGGWRLGGAVDLVFAGGTTIQPGQSLVAVGFDPSIDLQADQFRLDHRIDTTVELVGPYQGDLANDGGAVWLRRPLGGQREAMAQVDQIRFDSGPAWPAAANGQGPSLQRAPVTAFGPLAASWRAGDPTPGMATLVAAGDLDGNGQVDASDIGALVSAIRDQALYEATYGMPATLAGDADRDGDLDYDDILSFVALLRSGEASRTAGSDAVFGQETNWRPSVTAPGDVPVFGPPQHGRLPVRWRGNRVYPQYCREPGGTQPVNGYPWPDWIDERRT